MDFIWLYGLSLWCLTPLSTTYQLYRRCQFFWWRKPEYTEKTKDLQQVMLMRVVQTRVVRTKYSIYAFSTSVYDTQVYRHDISCGWCMFGLFCFCLMVFNSTFSATSWQAVSLLVETGMLGENHRPVASHWQTLSHNIVLSTPRNERGSNSQR
jgi:hypothetical protein